ncbi:hypothetical protein [Vibrio sp. MA40-2]|uniref:hypothetical protein n=1 Tax=Vibrio sp. MA40-2 TaxID=3391828 RepID=UPI0039A42252
MIWAILSSPMPMVASLSLIGSLVYALFNSHLETRMRKLEIHSNGELSLNNKPDKCKSVVTLYKFFMIQIKTDKGNKISIWRDSCKESDYRQLLVMIDLFMQKKKE